LDQLSDHTNTQKPIVYVHPTELYQIHQILEENIDYIESQKTGVVHTILRELGNAPVSTNTPLHLLRLELSDRSDAITKGSSCHKKLLLDTKRLIILVIQVQSGSSLEAILNEPSTDEHERIWEVVREEQFPSGGSEKDIEMALRERNFKFGCENAAMDVKK
jgi:Ras GTPase-activating-like protein IQGAP2/3